MEVLIRTVYSAPSTPELGSSPTSGSESTRPSPTEDFPTPLPNPYSPSPSRSVRSSRSDQEEYEEVAAATISGTVYSRPSSRASVEYDRRSASGFVTAHEEQHHSRFHTPAGSRQHSASRASSRVSSRSSRSGSHASSARSGVQHPAQSIQPVPPTIAQERILGMPAQPKPSSWSCRACLKEPHEPTATICGHIFCNK